MNSSLGVCSFCNRPQSEVFLLIEKPDVSICDDCVVQLSPLLNDLKTSEECEMYKKCSFCSFMANMPSPFQLNGHPKGKGMLLVGGPKYWICDGCLDLCNGIVRQRKANANVH